MSVNHVASEENDKIISDSKLKNFDIDEKCLLNSNQKDENLLNNNEDIHNYEFVEKNINPSKKETSNALPLPEVITKSFKSNNIVNESEILEESSIKLKNGIKANLSDLDQPEADSENKNIVKEKKVEEPIIYKQGIFHINKNSFFSFLNF